MISIYKNIWAKEPQVNDTINQYIKDIREGKWQDIVLDVRTGKKPKDKAPCVTLSGVFKDDKKASNLVEHSGFLCIDVDAKDQICDINKEKLKEDLYSFVIHDSISGNGGFVVLVKIDPLKHKEAFDGLEKYYFEKYNIVIDKSCKNVNRLRFVSFDPDIFVNEKAKTFKTYLKKAEKIQQTHLVVKSDFEDMVSQAGLMNLFDDYHDYIKCAFALSSEFGESGRQYFHALCQSSDKYDKNDADKHYTISVNRNGSGITIASLYYIFQQNGIKIKSQKTETILQIAKLSDNPKEALKELQIEDTDNLIEKVEKKERTKLDDVIDLIKLEKIRFNEITRNFEFKSEEMNDRILAEFYTKVWQRIDADISKDKIFTLIQNRNNTESYNPIKQWFKTHIHLVPENEFEKLMKCFKINHKIIDGDNTHAVESISYLKIYLKKWLISLVASAHGTYSLMILVLNGEQGSNKTKFFRNLLPIQLRSFYAESNLDEGKDSEILMTKKWLIVDDEFGGKSKKDATKLKRLSSQQTFSIRMPYGRVSEDLLRLAVLGGTSNDYEVINDPTGNRRIIPINVESFDFEAFEKIDKDLLFVELYNMWKADSEGWFLTKNEVDVLNKVTLENQEIMMEEEIIQKHIDSDEYGKMTTTDIVTKIMGNYPSIRTNAKRVGMALKKLGYNQRVAKIKGKTSRFYDLIWQNG